jgi:hypothetical protein
MILASASTSEAATKIETKTSPNYLIVLVHGVNTPGWIWRGGKGVEGDKGQYGSDVRNIPDSMRGFGDLLGYLQNDLGLDGYVYYYTFSQRDGRIETLAKELGDRNYTASPAFRESVMNHKELKDQPDIYENTNKELFKKLGYPDQIKQGNCWLEQAKQDFINWFKTEGPGKNREIKAPLPSEIPQKYILIAHSMGGLVARQYLSSDYYNNDVAAIITIDSQHLGSDGAEALKKVADFNNSDQALRSAMFMLGTSIVFFAMEGSYWDNLGIYAWLNGTLLPIGRGVIDDTLTKGMLGWYPNQPGVQDMNSRGAFIDALNKKAFVAGNQSIKARFIYSGGLPTPSSNLPLNRYFLGLSAIQTLFSSEYINDIPIAGKLLALYLSEALGAIVNQNGDLYGTVKSQRGEGLSILTADNVDFKSYPMTFGEDLNVLNDAVGTISSAVAATYLFCPKGVQIFAKIAAVAVTSTVAILAFMEGKENYLFAHGLAYKKVYEDKIIDKALEDFITFGGKANTFEAKAGLSAASVGTPVSGYTAAEQTFVLLSNLDKEGNVTATYHTVTIEAFTEGGGQDFPIEINGTKKWVSAVTVKEYPTAFKGVINTFLPKKLRRFNYSENFSAWKPVGVGVVDEWGNFTIKDMKMSEGVNVLAFEAESFNGNTTNRQLRITANSLPQFVGKPFPEPNSSTSNVNQKTGAEATKVSFGVGSAEGIAIPAHSLKKNGVLVPVELTVIQSREGYKTTTRAILTPKQPLSEGKYDVIIKFQSNVGVSQAMFSFYVDTTAPLITVATLEPYAARAPSKPLSIKYTTADNHSQFLKNVSISLKKGTEPVTEITTIATQAAGEQFITWDGKKMPSPQRGEGGPRASEASRGVGEVVEDGVYAVRVVAFDGAGNAGTATSQLKIDSTPPQIVEAHVSPNPMTKASSEFGFAGKISEKSTVILKLTNLSENQTTVYLTQSSLLDPGPLTLATYTWLFNDPLTPAPRDGLYRLEVIAKDAAGNESAPRTLEAIRIDRTPPVIFAQHTDPFVLANAGASPYQTTLRYQLSESNDAAENRQAASDLKVKVKIFNENTGAEIDSRDMPGKLSGENNYSWDAASSSIGKGSYKFQITAYDEADNYSTAYATCVKDGVAPAISYPLDNAEVAGTIIIRGTAMDPDWTNSLKFKQYRVYYKKGKISPPLPLGEGDIGGEGWLSDFIEVPEIYRTPGSPQRNVSARPVQNSATIAYLYAGSLKDGDYTILVVAEEEGGEKFASTRTVTVKNGGLSALSVGGANPAVVLGEIPPEITFDGKNSLPVSFTYGGKDINAYIEIMKTTGAGTRETAYYKYFPKLTANYYSGKPVYQSGSELGYFVWQDAAGWHVRWNGEPGKEHRFNGAITAAAEMSDFSSIGEVNHKIASSVNWDRKMTGGEGGFNFKTASTQLFITTSIDDNPTTYEDDVKSMVSPYFGMSKYQPKEKVVIITGITNQADSAAQATFWDGKIDTGAFVDSGNYIIRVRAEGADGMGLTVAERNIKVTTPFELANLQVSSASFNPLAAPDRVTVSYNISKDARIALKVFRPGDSSPLAIIDDGVQLGRTSASFPHQISWRGNFPDKEGTQVVTGGEYILKLTAAPVDGSPVQEKIAASNVRVETLGSSASVQLAPIGEEKKFNGGTVRAAQGSSDYNWEASATGTYYPPINYSYTLGIQGQQKAKVYPYVPFSGLVHRSFGKVFGKVRVTYKVFGHKWEHGFWGDLNPNPLWVGTDTTIVKEYPFELSTEKKTCEIPQSFSAAGLGWESVVASEVSIDFFSSGDELTRFKLDDLGTKKVKVDTLAYVYKDSCMSEKGVFNVVLEGTSKDFCKNWDDTIKIQLADGFDYSRLTNRFLPWYGFVNQNSSDNTDRLNLSQAMTDITRLGFPGGEFFKNANLKLGGKVDASPKYTEALRNLTNNSKTYSSYEDFKAAVEKIARESYFEGYSGGYEVTKGYTSYLSNEKFEFIPVEVPFRRDNSGNPMADSGGFTRDGMRWTAWTKYGMDFDLSPVTVKWPYDEQDVNDQEKISHIQKLDYLKANPQAYNISNTAYEIDKKELQARQNTFLAEKSGLGLIVEGGWVKRTILSDTLEYAKPKGYFKDLKTTLGNILPKSDYVLSPTYNLLEKNHTDINFNYTSNNQNSNLTVSSNRNGQAWSTADDPVLRTHSGGKIEGGPETFNKQSFSATGKSDRVYFRDAYKNKYLKYQSAGDLTSLFLKYPSNPGNLTDNPHLLIDKWEVALKDQAGQKNEDIEIKDEYIEKYSESVNIEDHFRAKLKFSAKEKKIVKLTGRTDSPYDLMYFDGKNWKTFASGTRDNNGTLAFWDVGRLCGKYTILLKTNNAIASQDIYIGDIVYYGIDDPENKRVTSAYKRAEVTFKPTSFKNDQFASVTPVTMSEIYIRNKPIIKTHGPILELKPSPYKFKTPADGEELRPKVRFLYTADDLQEGYGIITSPSDPDWKIKTQDLWIHQITADGDLELIQDKNQYLAKDADNNQYFAFEATADHFSTYILLNGKFKLSAPMVFADRYVTNKNSVTIYGTAEVGSVVTLYAKDKNIIPDTEKGELYAARTTADAKGKFRFEDVKLLQEGQNFIFVTAHQGDEKGIRTISDLIIVKDTIPPSLEAKADSYAFSPNGDGKFDEIKYQSRMNEKGKIFFGVKGQGSSGKEDKILFDDYLVEVKDEAVK